MTREEAINIIEDVTWQDNGRHFGKIAEARDMAIAALQGQEGKDANVLTNADRIRAMSDEEMAEWVRDRSVDSLCEIVCGGVCTAFDTLDKTSDQFCKEIVLKWLQQPADLGMEGCLRERAAEGGGPYGEAGQRGRKRKCGECQYGKRCYFPRGDYVVLCKKLSTDDKPVYRTPVDECYARMKEDDNAD